MLIKATGYFFSAGEKVFVARHHVLRSADEVAVCFCPHGTTMLVGRRGFGRRPHGMVLTPQTDENILMFSFRYLP